MALGSGGGAESAVNSLDLDGFDVLRFRSQFLQVESITLGSRPSRNNICCCHNYFHFSMQTVEELRMRRVSIITIFDILFFHIRCDSFYLGS